MLGVMATREAQRLADAQGLDLVEVSPNAEPPVCKIMDYGKFRYEESIKRKTARKNQKVVQIKEVKFHATTDTGDLEHKLRLIKSFIDEGDKVKITLQYRGRENAHKEIGVELVNKVVEACLAFAITEQSPKLIGRVLGCMLAPKPVKAGSSGGGGGGGSGGGSAAQTQAAPKTEQPQVHAPKPAARADFDPLQI
jgi:translation initiation factor IF-3